MDLQSLYGNLHNYEETTILHKEIMKQKFKDTPSALFSKNSSCNSDSDTKKSDDVDSESEYYVDLVSCVAKIVKHFGNFE